MAKIYQIMSGVIEEGQQAVILGDEDIPIGVAANPLGGLIFFVLRPLTEEELEGVEIINDSIINKQTNDIPEASTQDPIIPIRESASGEV